MTSDLSVSTDMYGSYDEENANFERSDDDDYDEGDDDDVKTERDTVHDQGKSGTGLADDASQPAQVKKADDKMETRKWTSAQLKTITKTRKELWASMAPAEKARKRGAGESKEGTTCSSLERGRLVEGESKT